MVPIFFFLLVALFANSRCPESGRRFSLQNQLTKAESLNVRVISSQRRRSLNRTHFSCDSWSDIALEHLPTTCRCSTDFYWKIPKIERSLTLNHDMFCEKLVWSLPLPGNTRLFEKFHPCNGFVGRFACTSRWFAGTFFFPASAVLAEWTWKVRADLYVPWEDVAAKGETCLRPGVNLLNCIR